MLPSERAARQQAENGAQPDGAPLAPLALVARIGNALRLTAVDRAALRLGLAADMTLADARARCPDLKTLPQDSEADARALRRLLVRMRRFTPLAAADPPDGLVLDITGCAHLFGGEPAMVRAILDDTGFTARHALAGHAAAARALARYGARHGKSRSGEDVHALPVAALELPDEAFAGLRRAGLFTLGDLARRPMAALAARFGETAVMRLRAILGETSSPIVARQPGAAIRAEARFAEPIGRTEDVLDVVETLLAETAGQMAGRHLGGRRFVVTLERSDGARFDLAVETARPTRAPAPVMRLLRERIDSLADPLDPGFGFDAIYLAVPRDEPLASRQIALGHDEAEEEEDVAALIDRLATRLGPDRVQRLIPRDTHIPEAAQRLVPATLPLRPAAALAPAPLPRPPFLFDPPEPITALAGVPDGPPLRFRWQGHVHEVRLAEGPERIAAEWWRQSEGHLDGGGLTRDYYRIEDAQGLRFWVFRHGLFEEEENPRWYLHGLFA